LSRTSVSVLGTTQPPIRWVPGRDVDHVCLVPRVRLSGVILPLHHMVSWLGDGHLMSLYIHMYIHTYKYPYSLAPQHGVWWTLLADRKGSWDITRVRWEQTTECDPSAWG